MFDITKEIANILWLVGNVVFVLQLYATIKHLMTILYYIRVKNLVTARLIKNFSISLTYVIYWLIYGGMI